MVEKRSKYVPMDKVSIAEREAERRGAAKGCQRGLPTERNEVI